MRINGIHKRSPRRWYEVGRAWRSRLRSPCLCTSLELREQKVRTGWVLRLLQRRFKYRDAERRNTGRTISCQSPMTNVNLPNMAFHSYILCNIVLLWQHSVLLAGILRLGVRGFKRELW